MKTVAIFHSPFKSKFGIPRQAGVVDAVPGQIVLEPEFRTPDAIRGIDGFDYLWLIWNPTANRQSEGKQSVTVRPPRLGGNTRIGVFASRSPYRPNPLCLSSVKIHHIEWETPKGPIIHVLGGDLMDNTEIYDIKPYISYTDAHTDARGGFTDDEQWQPLTVEWQCEVPNDIDRYVLDNLLAQDPRPHYHDDPDRVYGMEYDGYDIHFKVTGKSLKIIDIKK